MEAFATSVLGFFGLPGPASAESWTMGARAVAPFVAVAAAGLAALPRFLFLLLGLFSRIDPAVLDDHATRARLRSLIRERPGVTLTELARTTGLGWGTIVYHLNRLEDARLVHSESVARRRAFYLPGHAHEPATVGTLLLQRTKRSLLERLRQRPGLAQAELAREVGVGVPLAHRYLWQLEREGLVTSERRGKQRVYAPTAAPGPIPATPSILASASPAGTTGGLTSPWSPRIHDNPKENQA